MAKKYHLKLDPLIKDIVKFFSKYDKSVIKPGKAASSYLKPSVHDKINSMLDFLDLERKTNEDIKKDLDDPENKKILRLLDENIRF